MQSAKSSINNFWEWFLDNHERIERLIDEKKSNEALAQISECFEKNGLPRNLLIGKSGKYELTFTPERNAVIKLLSRAWREAAPSELSDSWDFLSAKKAEEKEFSIFMNNAFYPMDKFKFGYSKNENDFDIEVYSKGFKKLSEEDRNKVAMIALDNAFGEDFAEQRFSSVKAVRKKGEMKKKRCSFKKMQRLVKRSKKVPLKDPYDNWSLFKMNGESGAGIRKDIISFSTNVNEIITASETISATALEYGARYCGFALENGEKSKQECLDERKKFSEQINSFLSTRNLGYVVSEAFGEDYNYVEAFVLDDGELAACLSDIKGFEPKNAQLYFI